jgi:hypothetical protein
VSYEEKSAWIMVFLAVTLYAAYVVVVLGRADDGTALVDVDYIRPVLTTIGASIVGSIVLHMFIGGTDRRTDQRDKEISRRGDVVGTGAMVAGALGAMVMAMAEWDHFWIANLLYLSFVVTAILTNVTRIVTYRAGF